MSKRQYRKKAISEDGDEDGGERNDDGGHAGVDVELLQEAIELRKYRRRQHGLDAEDLLKGSGKKGGELEAAVPEKPPEVGGMIAAGFKTQTKAMDTERHMNEYVETELKKRRSPLGLLGEGGDMGDGQKSGVSDPLYEIPDHLKVAQQPVAEGSVTLSASMLTAIPEIDLGIDAKLRNIEETEKAKRKLMDDRAKPKDDTVTGAPWLKPRRGR
ncbi:hepatocellular carcinoma-associated antigen 59-domain-containing protein [Hyaloraphidium curvatum]|nr:hepatocellular carcinoma-associated antigen 59-domain-containing protein [Hyaloraphidium curvatum]